MITCSCDYDEGDEFAWYYEHPTESSILATKIAKRCCSCKTKLTGGDRVYRYNRSRPIAGDIEERIYGETVPLAAWYMCEECGDVALGLMMAGRCFSIDENIHEQLKEFVESKRAQEC